MKTLVPEYILCTERLGGNIVGDDAVLLDELRARIRELEDKVEALRISRRVLMNLIDTIEREKREKVLRLEMQNEKLQKNNCRYARAIMYRNVRITQLEDQLRLLTPNPNMSGNAPT